jgi:hypothetical protein
MMMAARATRLGLMALLAGSVWTVVAVPAQAQNTGAFGERWAGMRYVTESNWLSVHAGLGASVQQLNALLYPDQFAVGAAVLMGVQYHHGHGWFMGAELEYRDTAAPSAGTKAPFGAYASSNGLTALTVGMPVMTSEYWECTILLRLGLNHNSSRVTDTTAQKNYEYAGFQASAGGGVDLLFFPDPAVEVGLSLRTDEFIGTGSSPKSEWERDSAPKSSRLSSSVILRGGIHF